MAQDGIYGISAQHIAPGGVTSMTFEPQRVNNFVLEVGVPGQNPNYQIDRGQEQVIALSVISFPMPEERTTRIELHHGNEVRYVAGRTEFSEETLECVDYIDQETADVIYNWRRAVYNPGAGSHTASGLSIPRGGVGLAYQYKSEGAIWWVSPNGAANKIWNLHGIWPMTVRYGSGNMANSDKNTIEVTFSVDRITNESL